MTAPDIDIHALRRQLAAAHDLRIDKDDPILVAMLFAQAVVNKVIAEERAKRADENLLTYKDVRHVLEDVRNDSLQASSEIVGLALGQISKLVVAELAEERRTWAFTINRLKIGLAAWVGFGIAWVIL